MLINLSFDFIVSKWKVEKIIPCKAKRVFLNPIYNFELLGLIWGYCFARELKGQ
nr:hypothetical protein Itr_chr04CG13640 [Ipomoea trifida]